MTVTARLDEWKDAVKQAVDKKISSEVLQTTLTSAVEDNSEVFSDMEIVFRVVMDGCLREDAGKSGKADFVKTIALLNFSFDFALSMSSSTVNISKIPFLLLEDVFEYQTVNQAETMWTIVESLESKITHPELFPKGKLVILKMCNSILRKLSKSCHTEVSCCSF